MHQLDIFADSVPVQRANDLIAALSSFDSIASQSAMRHLVAADPHHAGLPQFQVLCNYIDRWSNSCNAPDWLRTQTTIAAEEELIREQIVPAAIVMGDARSDLVHKCWGFLAKASEEAGILPEYHRYFAAELYLRAQHYISVVRTAQKVPGADFRAAVQRWLGLGYNGCGMSDQAMSSVLRYAWLAPEQFNALVDEMGEPKLAVDWSNFQADLGDLDATWFPAWCAHEKIIGFPMLDNLPEIDGSMAYRLVMDLAIRERGGLCPAVYKDRARLKRLDESFFAFYMQRRSELHSRKA
jgi:hypothetical protein